MKSSQPVTPGANDLPDATAPSGNELADTRVTRRTFMQATAASVGALAMGGTSLSAMAAAGGRKTTATRYPLQIPAVFAPNGTLTCAPATVNMGDGIPRGVWAYNGAFPAPTLVANNGDTATLTLQNNLAEETITHWHGMIVNHENDGHPIFAVGPGSAYAYSFPIQQRACLNFYHPHPHMMTGKQVALGLAGAFIIRDAEEAALNLPSGKYEVPLIIRDAKFDGAGNLSYTAKSSGFLGSFPLINGTLSPYLDVDRAVYRFRVLNGANARLTRLALSNGAPFIVIGNDGGLLETAASVGQIEFSPGERLDLLVDFRGLAAGTTVLLRDVNAGWDLLEFRMTATSVAGTIPTGTLSTITPLGNPVVTRNFSFDGMSRINGLEYDVNRIDFQVPLGQTELWRFTTGGNAPHPVHVHGASFQVLSRTGGRGTLYPWESGWKDTVLLEDGETVEVLIRFTEYTGQYVLHCHKLEHEDMGMMSNFVVV